MFNNSFGMTNYFECGSCDKKYLNNKHSSVTHREITSNLNDELIGFQYGCINDIGRELTGSEEIDYKPFDDVRSFTSNASRIIINSKVRKMNTFIQDYHNTPFACGASVIDNMIPEKDPSNVSPLPQKHSVDPVPANAFDNMQTIKPVASPMIPNQAPVPVHVPVTSSIISSSQHLFDESKQMFMKSYEAFKVFCQKYRHFILTILVALILLAIFVVAVKGIAGMKIMSSMPNKVVSFMDMTKPSTVPAITTPAPQTVTPKPMSSFMDLAQPKV